MPASPTIEVKAPRPRILAPSSSAIFPVSTIRLMTNSSGSSTICFAVSGQPTNQPSASAYGLFTPVMCETSNGFFFCNICSSRKSGTYLTTGETICISSNDRGCSTNANFSIHSCSLLKILYRRHNVMLYNKRFVFFRP